MKKKVIKEVTIRLGKYIGFKATGLPESSLIYVLVFFLIFALGLVLLLR